MSTKQPVLLTLLLATESQQWFVGGIDREGCASPLLCSQPGNLAEYVGKPFDEQLSFLRHHLSGVLQRGCDRLWGKEQKPCQIVFIADGLLQQASQELTQRVADHFADWMVNPPVVFFLRNNAAEIANDQWTQLAGQLAADDRTALMKGIDELSSACTDPLQWEVVPNKPSTR